MSPRPSSHDPRHLHLGDAVLVPECLLRDAAVSVSGADSGDDGVGEFGVRVLCAPNALGELPVVVPFSGRSTTALGISVGRVIGCRPKGEVVWVDTRRVVAPMQHHLSSRDRTTVDGPSVAVREHTTRSAVDPNVVGRPGVDAVAASAPRRGPFVATRFRYDMTIGEGHCTAPRRAGHLRRKEATPAAKRALPWTRPLTGRPDAEVTTALLAHRFNLGHTVNTNRSASRSLI